MMEISFYREKLSESGNRVLNASIEESQRRHHYYLGLEHLFIAFADQEKTMFQDLMAAIGLNVDSVLYSVNEHLNISRQYLGVGLKVPRHKLGVPRRVGDGPEEPPLPDHRRGPLPGDLPRGPFHPGADPQELRRGPGPRAVPLRLAAA
jgi:hypothetical protein